MKRQWNHKKKLEKQSEKFRVTQTQMALQFAVEL